MTRKKIEIKPEYTEIGRVDAEKQELIKKINDKWPFHMYHQAREIIQSVMFPLFRNAANNNTFRGKIRFLYGDFNTGKSYLLEFVTELIRTRHQNLWKSSHRPIQILVLHDNINTAKQFYLYLLDELKEPMEANLLKKWKLTDSVKTNLRDRVIKTLERLNTRILILDECQRLLKAKNQDIPSIFEALKDLTNKKFWNGNLRTHFVLCGTDEAYTILSVENWIQGRTYTIRLEELTPDEYPDFLQNIYDDYIELGISEEWDLYRVEKESGVVRLNLELAEFLFEKSLGRVGLTVDIIKGAILHALNNNRLYPIRKDYELVIPEDTVIDPSKKIEIVLDFHDRSCRVKGCPKSSKVYKLHKDLITHYRKKHPEYILKNKDGHEIR